MYTAKDIVTRGRIGSAQIPFAIDVEGKLAYLEEETERLLGVSLSHDMLRTLSYELVEKKAFDPKGGFGYVTASRRYDRDKEVYWAAVIAHYVQTEDFIPIIIPIDDLYQYHVDGIIDPERLTLVHRLNALQDIQVGGKRPYAIITGFTESKVFDEEAVWNIPSNDDYSRALENYLDTLTVNEDERDKIIQQNYNRRRSFYKEIEANLKDSKSLEDVIVHFSDRGLDQKTVKFLVAYGLLKKQGDWQGAWGESDSGIICSTLVFPQPAFFAFSNTPTGVMHVNIVSRATDERYTFPPLEVVDGKLVDYRSAMSNLKNEKFDLNRTNSATEILQALSVLYP